MQIAEIRVFTLQNDKTNVPILLVTCNGAVVWAVSSPTEAGALARGLFETLAAAAAYKEAEEVAQTAQGHKVLKVALGQGKQAVHVVMDDEVPHEDDFWFDTLDAVIARYGVSQVSKPK